MDAEQHLGETQCEAVVADRHPVGAGQREFKSSAERKAFDGSHRRAGQGLESVDDRLARLGQPLSLFDAPQGREFVDVRPGDETTALSRSDHETAWRVLFERGQNLRGFLQHLGVQAVGRCVGLVERQPGDPLVVGLDTAVS